MAAMNDTPETLAALKAQYRHLRQGLARTGYISHGSVQQRSVAASGRKRLPVDAQGGAKDPQCGAQFGTV